MKLDRSLSRLLSASAIRSFRGPFALRNIRVADVTRLGVQEPVSGGTDNGGVGVYAAVYYELFVLADTPRLKEAL